MKDNYFISHFRNDYLTFHYTLNEYFNLSIVVRLEDYVLIYNLTKSNIIEIEKEFEKILRRNNNKK